MVCVTNESEAKVLSLENKIKSLNDTLEIYKLYPTKNSKKISCEDCKEDLDSYSDIKKHILINCNEGFPEEIIECDNCDFTTLQEFILKIHKKDCQPLKFKCDKCKSQFKTPSLLKKHIQSIH